MEKMSAYVHPLSVCGSLQSNWVAPRICASRSAQRRRCAPTVRMARYQQRKEEPGLPNEEDDKKSPLRPTSSNLPTLSSLSGRSGYKAPKGPKTNVVSENAQELKMMGPGINSANELRLITFLKNTYKEVYLIDWPSPARVVKLTFLVMLTVAIASAFVYTVDGIFLRLSQMIFEKNAV